MTGLVLIDELHLQVRVPRGLSKPNSAAVNRVLKSMRFQHELRQVIRRLFRQFQALKKVRFTISR